MGLIGEWRRQKKNISDLEDKTIEITQTEKQRGHRLKENKPILKDLWNHNEDLTFLSLESQDRRKRGELIKGFPKYGKIHKPTYSRS